MGGLFELHELSEILAITFDMFASSLPSSFVFLSFFLY